MGEFTIRLPDVGEGIAEAELTAWHVKIGDIVREDDIIAEVMTEKAAVEIPSEVSGKVVWLGGTPGDMLAIGGDLARIEVEGDGNRATAAAPPKPAEKPEQPATRAPEPAAPRPEPKPEPKPEPQPRPMAPARPTLRRPEGDRPLAAPSVRRRAREAGADLRQVMGSGPAGRITHDDLSAFLEHGPARDNGARQPDTSVSEERIIGLRKRIAERMALSKSRIPHITIVEEVDMTDLEALRAKLNSAHAATRGKLTVLPFLMLAIAEGVAEQPAINAHFDDDAGILRKSGGVHVGIATQTGGGLVVPVVRHVEAMTLWEAGAELARLSQSARESRAGRDELKGSTITITSLGPMGAIATTPIINYPEVAIVGVNKMQMRPMWDGAGFVPRRMMNISCAFDHRVIDGWDAAVFVQKLKSLLETPALLFVKG
jgi:2-oxoisovalerate dehydrogenase E2 component (dihydrolipoyl transacylase)